MTWHDMTWHDTVAFVASRTESRVCVGNSATTLCSAGCSTVQLNILSAVSCFILFHCFVSVSPFPFWVYSLPSDTVAYTAICSLQNFRGMNLIGWMLPNCIVALHRLFLSNTLRTSISPSVSTQGLFMHWAVAHNGFLCATALDPDSASPLGRESSTEITGHLCFSESVCTSQQVFKGVLLHYGPISF